MSPHAVLVSLEDVDKTYADIPVLKHARLDIVAGEVHALVGENGAGKSTLMKILAGVESPDPGARRTYFGERLESVDPTETLQLGISVIYQDLSLFPNLSVAENLAFALARKNKVAYQPSRWLGEARRLLGRLGLRYDPSALVETLSFGQRQMLAIARAVAIDARVIVMDEPTSALSSADVALLFSIVDELRSKGVGIVFISHKLDEVFRIADRVSVLRDGQVVASGPVSEFSEDDLITAMVGRHTVYEPLPSVNPPGAELLRVDDLVVRGASGPVSFSVRAHEIVAITGLVGSGRTELAETIFGLAKPESGAIVLNGKQVRISSPAEAVELGIAYVPEDRRLQGVFGGHSIRSNISVASLKSLAGRSGRVGVEQEAGLVDHYLAELDIRPRRSEADAATLSGGNQQKVVLARWLAAHPQVLIVDEPTNGIDIGAKREIHQLIRRTAESGTGVVVISSELPEVLAVADRILIMRAGRIVAETTPELSTQESILAIELAGEQ